MAEKASDLASSKGKKKHLYSMEFKKQVVYAEANSNRSAASHFDVEPKRVREWKINKLKWKIKKLNLLNQTDSDLMEEEESALTKI